MDCRNCGDLVDSRRVELGYDYCLKEDCQQRCLKRVELAAVGVNKAADYYMKAEEVLPPRPPAPSVPTPASAPAPGLASAPAPGLAEPDDLAALTARPPRPTAGARKPPKTTIERLRDQERELDEALGRSYERFRTGEITAMEMHRERDQLVGAFNRQVKGENIRYRSLLRQR